MLRLVRLAGSPPWQNQAARLGSRSCGGSEPLLPSALTAFLGTEEPERPGREVLGLGPWTQASPALGQVIIPDFGPSLLQAPETKVGRAKL